LPFGIDGVEGQGGFTRATDPGNDDKFIEGEVKVEVFEIILTGAVNCYMLEGSHDESLEKGLRTKQ
jgi:hypothetical protein